VKGLNALALEAVRNVLDKTPDAIVIIMGDHGSRLIGKKDEALTVFLAYKGPNSKGVLALDRSSKIFELLFNEFKSGTNN
jgi:hypothetical protein